jgi:Tfp pilus assembly protein FimT
MIVPCPDSRVARSSHGFTLVLTLVMVALLAIIAVAVFTSASLERITAKSYEDRYQAELAAQNGLEAAKQTLVASPNITNSITGTDTFLVARADGAPDANGNKPAYYYLAKPADVSTTSSSITYYPLFSSSTDPSAPAIQTTTIDLTAPFAPAVPTPAAPANSTPPPANSTPTPGCTTCNPAWNAAKSQRLPGLYSWQQPTPTPSGPSVQWVEMRDPQDTATAPAHNLPYTRYAYWAEDLDGYLDASQVGGQARASGTTPQEIAMWTVFNSTPQTDPGTTAATALINNRPLLFTVPTVRQIAQTTQTTPDAGPNLAVRLGVDAAEQNLVPLGYGYGTGGQSKATLNPISKLQGNGNISAQFATPISTAMPNFVNRTLGTGTVGRGPSGTVNYLNNLGADLVDYAFALNAPTEFAPPGNPTGPPSSRGIGAYPFVVSVYDLNNWVFTYGSNTTNTYHVVIEVKTYVQLWNPHNMAVRGVLRLTYHNSDKVNLNGNTFTLSSPPDTNVIFKDPPLTSETDKPVIASALMATGNVGTAFSYQILAGNGLQLPTMQSNEYRVAVLPGPAIHDISSYDATGLPPGLHVQKSGKSAGLISGTPTTAGTYNVTITATNSSGTGTATLVITIN